MPFLQKKICVLMTVVLSDMLVKHFKLLLCYVKIW